ncbi:ABC-2 family transporter protein [Paenibacillus sp. FSL L8-0340]|uniref:ABC transporter permease n=1 Tax=Paenibacillus sp. FSL L8-0340 TaxID=2954685 RepID=UPI0031580A3D
MGIVQIYLKLINISMKSRMQYRTDFLTGILGILVFNAINISLIGIIVTRFVHLNGWSIWELVFLYSLWILGHSIFSLLFWQLTSMEEYLINGTFDQFLTRPISPLVQLLGREIQYLGIGDAIIGILGITLAYYNLGLDWSFFEFIYFLVSVLSGTGIEVAIFWMIACISFWTGRSMTASTVLWRINSMVQQYPIDIFGKWFQIVVTGIIPVAFMNFYPSIALLGKTDAYDHPNWINYMSPIVAIVLLLIASKIWSLALKRYSSSGN